MRLSRRTHLSMVAVCILAVSGYAPLHASAAFKVSPTVLELRRGGGQGALGTISVELKGERGSRFRAVVQDIRQLPDGTQTYEQPSGSPFSAASWVSIRPARFSGGPDRTQPVQYQVLVPASAEPGDHIASLTIQRLPTGGRATATPIEAISVRLTIRVRGRAKPAARVVGLDVPGIAGGGPVAIGATVRNTGNVTLDFDGANRGRVAIMDGDDRKVTLPFTGSLLPGATRVFNLAWESPPLLGNFDAVASVDTGRRSARASEGFWVIPWRQIGALILVVLAVLTLALGIRRRRWG